MILYFAFKPTKYYRSLNVCVFIEKIWWLELTCEQIISNKIFFLKTDREREGEWCIVYSVLGIKKMLHVILMTLNFDYSMNRCVICFAQTSGNILIERKIKMNAISIKTFEITYSTFLIRRMQKRHEKKRN